MLDSATIEAHEHEILELGMHWYTLILLGGATHVYAVLRLTLGDDTRRPPGDDTGGTVHRRHDLAADLSQLRVGQPSHPVHERVQLFDQARYGRYIGRYLERPVFAVFAALVKILSVCAVS